MHTHRPINTSLTLAGALMVFMAFYRLVSIAIYGSSSEPAAFTNHFVAILTYWVAGGWCLTYARQHSKSVRLASELKAMKILSLLAGVLSWCRAITLVVYFMGRFTTASSAVTICYELADMVLWCIMGVFFLLYWQQCRKKEMYSSNHHHHHHHGEHHHHEEE